MRTKFHIIVGSTTHELSTTDIKNWDEVKFTLERKDYSGVTRTFSSQFEFVGSAYTLLRDLYLTDGFLASAYVAVSTKNNDWTYTEQFRCPLDFSTIEIADGVLTISSIDNTLAGLLKAKKSTKFEWPISDFQTQQIEIARILMTNTAHYYFEETEIVGTDANNSWVGVIKDSDALVTTEYIEPSNASHEEPAESFFVKVNKIGAYLHIFVNGRVRCYFSPNKKGQPYNDGTNVVDIPIAQMRLRKLEINDTTYQLAANLFNDDILHTTLRGHTINMLIGGSKDIVFNSLNELKAFSNLFYNGQLGVVGNARNPAYSQYWTENIIYEYQNGNWINRGAPDNYYQDHIINATASLGPTLYLTEGCYLELNCLGKMWFYDSSMNLTWDDPKRETIYRKSISPVELATKIVQGISPSASVVIDDDEDEVLTNTVIMPGEELRQLATPKVYSTFQNFAEWIESVFGYSYKIENETTVHFMHRSNIFGSDVVKVIDFVNDVKFSIDTDLIYAEVQAGYAKKDYGEINGRYEKNFTNYYTTGYNATDKKLQLISKYRADVYGIEFTARKSESKTTDDKADEDIFTLFTTMVSGVMSYGASNSELSPENCIANNKAFIAALGNGKAITLTMTSSDGDNELSNISIVAGTALFTASKIEFKTDDMIIPEDWDGVLQFDHGGYRFKGYISKAEASYGRQSGVEYTLIVKSITKL